MVLAVCSNKEMLSPYLELAPRFAVEMLRRRWCGRQLRKLTISDARASWEKGSRAGKLPIQRLTTHTKCFFYCYFGDENDKFILFTLIQIWKKLLILKILGTIINFIIKNTYIHAIYRENLVIIFVKCAKFNFFYKEHVFNRNVLCLQYNLIFLVS